MAAILLCVSALLVAVGVGLYSIPAGVITAGILVAAYTIVFVYDWTPEKGEQ